MSKISIHEIDKSTCIWRRRLEGKEKDNAGKAGRRGRRGREEKTSGRALYLSRKKGPRTDLTTCSVVEPSTISTNLEWWEVPMKRRSKPPSL